MILASFNYNNKEYVYLINGNNIEYGYKNKEGICKKLNREEINLMNTMYKKIMISKDKTNHKKCGIVNHNDKKFQIMYDKISGNKFFYEIIDNSFKIPTYKDYIYLDSMLNPTSLYSSKYEPGRLTENNNGSPNAFKNCIKKLVVGTLTISLSIPCLYMAFYTKTLGPLNNPYLDLPETTITEQYYENSDKTITLEDLQKAIENNSNLDNIEKEIFLSSLTIIEENLEYINMPMVYDRLSNVNITYNPQTDVPGPARYKDNNEIEFFCCNSNEEFIEKYGKEEFEKYFKHEINHLFTSKGSILGYKIKEAMTEILTCEYNGYDLTTTKNATYWKQRVTTYMLIELLGTDTLKQYYFSDNPQILINALREIIDDEDKACELLGEVDNLEIKLDEAIKRDDENSKTSYSVHDYTFESFNKLFDEYFYKKYGYDMMEDEIIKSYILMQRSNKGYDGYPYEGVFQLECEDLRRFNHSYTRLYEFSVTPIVYFSQEHIREMYPDEKPKIKIEEIYGYGIFDENGNSQDSDYQNTVSIDVESAEREINIGKRIIRVK